MILFLPQSLVPNSLSYLPGTDFYIFCTSCYPCLNYTGGFNPHQLITYCISYSALYPTPNWNRVSYFVLANLCLNERYSTSSLICFVNWNNLFSIVYLTANPFFLFLWRFLYFLYLILSKTALITSMIPSKHLNYALIFSFIYRISYFYLLMQCL